MSSHDVAGAARRGSSATIDCRGLGQETVMWSHDLTGAARRGSCAEIDSMDFVRRRSCRLMTWEELPAAALARWLGSGLARLAESRQTERRVREAKEEGPRPTSYLEGTSSSDGRR
jgi:hypothetical protein